MRKYIFSSNKKKNLLKTLCWLSIILYMSGIFYFSNQSGSQSDKVSEGIVTEIKQHFSVPSFFEEKNFIQQLDFNNILRKGTHFAEYFILALMFYLTLRICSVRQKTTNFITFIFCTIYASLDEYHQSFIMGRSSALRDVLIDVSGGILALIILFIRRLSKDRIIQDE